MYTWEISSCKTFSSTSAIAPSSPTASVLLFFVEAWLYVEKHTGECPASHGQTTGDSCCHEIGTSLIDECTAVDKPLHGWTESDLFALGSRHIRPSIDDRGGNLCICLRQGSAKSRLLRSVDEASNPEFLHPTLRGHTSTARHESYCRNGQPRRWSAPASEELAKGSFRQL